MGGKVIYPVQFHARSSTTSRAAKRVRRSAETPAVLALSVDKTAAHHSDGMLSRFSHLRTAQGPAPTSAAIASLDSQRSMIERNEVKSGMDSIMGQSVPKIKAIVSHDYEPSVGQYVQMAEPDDDVAESEWRDGFRARLKAARGKRTQEDMAELLCISRDAYSKYEGSRASAMPIRLLPRFAKICGVDLLELIQGPRAEKQAPKRPAPAARRKSG
jgi:hypothetical protein